MLWIVDNRGFSRRGLSLAAGLSQSHVGQIIRGDKKGRVSHSVLAAIAKAAQVNLTWLATGEGSPLDSEDAQEHTEVYEPADVVYVVEQFLEAMGEAVAPKHAAELRGMRWGTSDVTVDMVASHLEQIEKRDKGKAVEKAKLKVNVRPGRVRLKD